MKSRLAVVAAATTLLFLGAGCGAKQGFTPSPVEKRGVPNAEQLQGKPVNTAAKPTADDGLNGALNDLNATQ